MKRPNIKCPYCGSQAFLRPASVLNKHGPVYDGEKYYVCARYPFCDSYVKAHAFNEMPMGTLANSSLRRKRRDAHIEMQKLWEHGLMTRKEAYRWLQTQMGLTANDAHIAKFSEQRCEQVILLRLATFLKLVLLKGTPFSKARVLFEKDYPNDQEVQVMALSRQALLSTAELIKCAEVGATDISTDRKLLNALYADSDTTCDNIRYMMQDVPSQAPITMAVANLYLRKQIIFEKV